MMLAVGGWVCGSEQVLFERPHWVADCSNASDPLCCSYSPTPPPVQGLSLIGAETMQAGVASCSVSSAGNGVSG